MTAPAGSYPSLDDALFAAQAACPGALKHDADMKIGGRTITYASSEQIVAITKPILHAHGLMWSLAPSVLVKGGNELPTPAHGFKASSYGDGQFARPSQAAGWVLKHPATKEAQYYTVESLLTVGDLALNKSAMAAWTVMEGYALRRLLMLPTGDVDLPDPGPEARAAPAEHRPRRRQGALEGSRHQRGAQDRRGAPRLALRVPQARRRAGRPQ